MTLRLFSGGVGRLTIGLFVLFVGLALVAQPAKAVWVTGASLSPEAGPPGTTVTVTVTAWQAAMFQVDFDGTMVTWGDPDANGNGTVQFQVPQNAAAGVHDVDVIERTCWFDLGCTGDEFSLAFTVTSPPPAAPIVIELGRETKGRRGEQLRTVCAAVRRAVQGKLRSHGEHNLVLVTHGWSGPGKGEDWQGDGHPEETAGLISQALGSSRSDWDVVAFNWRTLSEGDTFQVPQVRENALNVGTCLGAELSVLGYDHIHLIGHSAGTSLVHKASQTIFYRSPATSRHLTLLDAYTPDGIATGTGFGKYANFSEHYVRDDSAPWLSPTDSPIQDVCNLDTTLITVPADAQEEHGGPWNYYDSTIDEDATPFSWGFGKSKEITGEAPTMDECLPGELGVMNPLYNGGVYGPALPD